MAEPLHMLHNGAWIRLSDITAIVPHTHKAFYQEGGDINIKHYVVVEMGESHQECYFDNGHEVLAYANDLARLCNDAARDRHDRGIA